MRSASECSGSVGCVVVRERVVVERVEEQRREGEVAKKVGKKPPRCETKQRERREVKKSKAFCVCGWG